MKSEISSDQMSQIRNLLGEQESMKFGHAQTLTDLQLW